MGRNITWNKKQFCWKILEIINEKNIEWNMRGVEKFGKCLQGKQKSFKVSLATFWSSNAEVLKTILRLGMWYDSCHIVSYECDCVYERSAFNKNVLWRPVCSSDNFLIIQAMQRFKTILGFSLHCKFKSSIWEGCLSATSGCDEWDLG